ncbi:glycosyltransferase family 2 protein [Paenibacillus sp. HB172176]|uniref:glycosyltransferase family 2 protein n=1 Tax=Paenibacillus sp. HB172176 TaxID=2493690 RepID=UPI00143A9D4D|nr:glycosyltransferase family 2 protein [Paenibacillus sp. HB172176]
MPTTTVCIVTYNSGKDIADCLDAVMEQVPPVASIVIVDNASSDDTVSRLQSFNNGKVPIKLLLNKVNNGFSGGQNQAIAAAGDSDYVLVLNPDVRLAPDYVAELLKAMEREFRIGSATGQLVFAHDPTIVDSTGLAMDAFRQARDRGAGESVISWKEAGEVFGVSGAASMYARRMIDDISLEGEFFDEQFFAYKEDVDVAWRARRLGWTAYYEPEAQALHARGWKKGARRSVPLFIRQHSYMNRFYVLVKNERAGWHMLWRLPAVAAIELLRLGYLLARETAVLKCLPMLFKTLPSMLRKRSMIELRVRARREGLGREDN